MMNAFQGEPGAYSEAAILEHYADTKVEPYPCETFEKVFKAVSDGTCPLGFIPIENSLAGSIHQNYDLLLRNELTVVGEHRLRVSHCLIGLPGVEISQIRTVISHPQALAQCDGFLHTLPGVQIQPVYDTAGSVKLAREKNDPTVAAIASRRAASIYGMQILRENIEDDPSNFTRFLMISKTPLEFTGEAKTSIVFSLDNRAGALFRALSALALRDIDLTKIESRPLVGKPFEYFFYIDFVGSTKDVVVKNALSHLQEYAPMFRVLGCYPRSK